MMYVRYVRYNIFQDQNGNSKHIAFQGICTDPTNLVLEQFDL